MRISIHAPRVGSDSLQPSHFPQGTDFNPRSPCGERPNSSAARSSSGNFNPRSPCGERLLISLKLMTPIFLFQSTLPVWGATVVACLVAVLEVLFQSTLPVWGATDTHKISHRTDRFQSTLPVWGATRRFLVCLSESIFQSTLPVWGATAKSIRPSRQP